MRSSDSRQRACRASRTEPSARGRLTNMEWGGDSACLFWLPAAVQNNRINRTYLALTQHILHISAAAVHILPCQHAFLTAWPQPFQLSSCECHQDRFRKANTFCKSVCPFYFTVTLTTEQAGSLTLSVFPTSFASQASVCTTFGA